MIVKLEEHFLTYANALESLARKGIVRAYGLIGGGAVGALGIPRGTKDIDFLVVTENPEQFVQELEKLIDKAVYSIEFKRPQLNVFAYYAVFCYVKEDSEKFRVCDILIPTLKWQQEIACYTVSVNFTGHSIPVVNTEGLIVLKLKAGGTQDFVDVKNLLSTVDIDRLDHKKLNDWAQRAGVNKLLKKLLREQEKKHRKEQ